MEENEKLLKKLQNGMNRQCRHFKCSDIGKKAHFDSAFRSYNLVYSFKGPSKRGCRTALKIAKARHEQFLAAKSKVITAEKNLPKAWEGK